MNLPPSPDYQPPPPTPPFPTPQEQLSQIIVKTLEELKSQWEWVDWLAAGDPRDEVDRLKRLYAQLRNTALLLGIKVPQPDGT